MRIYFCRRFRPPRRVSLLFFIISVALFAAPTTALWPFPPKRFSGNALIRAGSLGLDDGDGRVIAFGDFNGDHFVDVMMLASDQHTISVYLWSHDDFSFHRSASFRHPQRIYNVVPGDYTHDGKLDVLVMSQSASSTQLSLSLYTAKSGGGFHTNPTELPPSSLAQPIPFDSDGLMRIDLLGLQPGSSQLKTWKNTWNASEPWGPLFEIVDAPFSGPQCRISNPHSNAAVDLDGDCIADIFLVCDEGPGRKSFQIWVSNSSAGFTLAQSGSLPAGTQSVVFADMDRDGTIDLVVTTCTSVSQSTGLGTNCALNIAYNTQLPLCVPSSSFPLTGNPAAAPCRTPDKLCVADPKFSFTFSGPVRSSFFFLLQRPPQKSLTHDQNYVSVPISDLLQGDAKLQVLDTSFSPAQPVLPRTGDADLDGFPDWLLVTEGRVRLLLSVPCARGVPGCAASNARRGWREVRKGVEALANIVDARGAVFVDMDEDGTLDVMVQRTGEQGEGRVLFVQNNFYYDAFFMKAILLNGACSSGWCIPENSSLPWYPPSGAITSGASYKYTILDTSGRRSAAQIPQLPQTSYQALNTPYAFFGLGRTNNYIENLFAGVARHRVAALEMVIPNSKLVINPGAEPGDWHKELYLRPGQWIPWVGLTVLGTMVALAGVVLILHLNEKREDELERRRASHHINFDAL
ncbi:hypothetical protein B0F90DRAFT_1709692 [Multifurca ochricompacta]|uniref:T-cell immunomodulatory protein TIP C2 domain-containing protein n=1 Tax=Multifurca ochricompacta TaxID=376703 RepID=A0AAD4QN77_9AGAM|nr:hypothetical protein B0F90DRAFT_1709692 [Multifurca ochricompacta]